MSDRPEHIEFANQLRGFAAFSVLFSHFTGAFWGRPADVGKVLGLPAQDYGGAPGWLVALADFEYFSFGPFGVALFFLVSGFVIPLSLERLGPFPFLVARVIRIWPTYAVGFGFAVLVLAAYHFANGSAFPYPLMQVAIQFALVLREWLWVGVVDGIVWTLEVELKFYVAMAVLFWLTRAFRMRDLIAIAIVLSIISIGFGLAYDWLLTEHVWWFKRLAIVSITATFFPYMFIGTGFYLIHTGRMSVQQLASAAVILLVASFASWTVGFLGIGPVTAGIVSYLAALALFACCFATRKRFRANLVTDFLAAVSYPLYVTHFLVGLLLMYVLVGFGWSPYAVMAAATATALFIAWSLHVLVEKPTQTAGRRLGRRLAGGQHILPAAPMPRPVSSPEPV